MSSQSRSPVRHRRWMICDCLGKWKRDPLADRVRIIGCKAVRGNRQNRWCAQAWVRPGAAVAKGGAPSFSSPTSCRRCPRSCCRYPRRRGEAIAAAIDGPREALERRLIGKVAGRRMAGSNILVTRRGISGARGDPDGSTLGPDHRLRAIRPRLSRLSRHQAGGRAK